MTIKIGINDFGRIGRNVLRSALANFSIPGSPGVECLEMVRVLSMGVAAWR